MIRILLLMAIICCCVFTHAYAQNQAPEQFDYSAFEKIPVLDNGRVKPIGAFAKARLKDFYGKDYKATQWLAQTLFNPSEAIHAEVFTIKDDDLKSRLALDPSKDHFSIEDLQPGLKKTQSDIIVLLKETETNLTPQQQTLLKIHEDVISYNELLRSFSLILPLKDGETFINLLPKEQRITSDLKTIIAQKGQDVTTYTPAEQETAIMGFQLQQIRTGGIGNDDFKAIPVNLDEKLSWASPWQTINDGLGSPQANTLLSQWEDVANAHRKNDAQNWTAATHTLLENTLQNTSNEISKTRLNVELLYLNIKPYHVAMSLYALGIILLIITLSRPSIFITYGTLVSLFTACLFHVSGIAARIYILDRPPVGTLYESVLFVSLICAVIGLITYAKSRKPILALTSQIAALGLLSIAPTMLQNNDSLELLVAVLNTNFWLGTHVICITAGYGICIIGACLAHGYMLLRIKDPVHPLLDGAFQSIHKIGLVALLFTAVGTVLGGIWADQSWGRFWGWDPKENGALLIVLWLIWIQHGRLSGNIRPLGYVAGMAALNIVVALAWFGVNLLGVGLHSYGFTSGIAAGLAIFCIAETIIITALWIIIRIKQKQQGRTS
ncbi:MAG: cytochrome c biogenesis protein CcsA [Alphaproteobacteria bacterium]|nr:cytochrome c biogenesis protein CcsA [Alphaproteobacteria bacterium]